MSDVRIVAKTDKLNKQAQVLAKITGLTICKEKSLENDIVLQISEYTGAPGYHLELIQI